MKSIISRYGEMKADPSKLVDSEGEAMSLNKVDKALQSVGISIQDVNHQFRDFDDVIIELAEKWNTIDKNTQRYIATIMAGNRQQSRFLALVSSYDRLKELSMEAANAEDAAQLQYLKTLDSVDAKIQQLQTSIQSLYVNSGLETFYKWLIDSTRAVIDNLISLNTWFKLPIPAIAAVGAAFWNLTNVVHAAFTILKAKLALRAKEIRQAAELEATQGVNERVILTQVETEKLEAELERRKELFRNAEDEMTDIHATGVNQRSSMDRVPLSGKLNQTKLGQSMLNTKAGQWLNNNKIGVSIGASLGSMAVSMLTNSVKNEQASGWLNTTSSALSGVSMGAAFGPVGMLIGGLGGTLLGFISNWDKIVQSDAKKLEQLQKEAESARNTYIQKKSDEQNLNSQIEQLKKLSSTRHEGAEAEAEYQQIANELVNTYPSLIKSIDAVGNITLDLEAAERTLQSAREDSLQATIDLAQKEYNFSSEKVRQAQNEAYNAEEDFNQTFTFSPLLSLTGSHTFDELFEVYFSDISTLEKATKIQELLHQKETNYDSFTNTEKDFFNKFQEKTNAVLMANQKLNIASDTLGTVERSGVTKIVSDKLKMLPQKQTGNIEKFNEILTMQILKNPTSYNLSNPDKSQLTDTIVQYEDEWSNFWKDLTEEEQKQFNELLKNRDSFSWGRMYDELKTSYEDLTLDMRFAIMDALYEDVYEVGAITEKYVEKSNQGEDLAKIMLKTESYNLFSNLGQQELKAIDSFYNQINNLDISKNFKEQLLNNYLEIAENIEKIKDTDLREQASSIFYSWDGTLENFVDIGNQLTELGIGIGTIGRDGKTAIQRLKENLPINLVTEFNIFTQELASASESLDKTLSKAIKGMDYKDALELAEQLNITLSNFSFRNGKYYYDSAEAIKQIQENFDKTSEEYYNDLISRYNKQLALAQNKNATQTNEFGGTRLINILDVLSEDQDWQLLDTVNEQEEHLTQIGFPVKEANDIISLYNTYYDAWAALNDTTISFSQYVITQLNEAVANTEEGQKNAKYQARSSLLQLGLFEDFIKDIFGENISDELLQKYIQQISHGDISNLPEELQQYAKLIYDTYHSIYSSITDSILQAAEGGNNKIEVTSTNQWAIQDAIDKGWIDSSGELIEEQFVEVNVQKLKESEKAFSEWIQTAYDNEQDRYKALTSFHNIKYADISGSMSSIITDNGEIAYDSLMKYFETLGKTSKEAADALEKYGLEIDKQTGIVKIIDLNEYIRQLKEDAQQFKNDIEKYNETMAKLYDAQHYKEIQRKKAYEQVLKNYNSLSSTDRADFATALGDEFNKVTKYFEENGDGTFKLNIGEIRKALENGTLKVGKATEEYLQELIYGIMDDYLDAISTATGYISQGTTKQSDIQNFSQQYKDIVGTELENGFTWNSELQTYILNQKAYIEYIKKLKEKYASDFGNDAANNFINSELTQAQDALDVVGFLSSERTTIDRGKLKQEIQTIYNLREEEIEEETLNNIINTLQRGGKDAIEELKKLKPNASSEEIQNVYRAVVDDQLNALESISSLTTGQIIATNGALYDALKTLGMVDNNGVVNETFNMVKAYKQIYDSMKDTAGKTQSDLNKAYADVLTAGEQQEINAIEAMSNAMDMTYYQLGEILGKQGKDLEDFMKNKAANLGIEQIGNGKIRLNDFNAFAKEMGWEYGSEEYLSAFKAYNDSLVELNRQTEKSILEEVKNVISANRGDKVNLTYLMDTLGASAEQILNEQLKEYGASIKNGILTISEGADLIGISQTIQNVAESSGKLMEEELAEITDSITEAINNYSELLIKGITGNLTNVDLQKLMKDSELQSVTYEKTADGLRLTQEYLIRLYSAMDAGVNKIKVFDELNKYLQENNENYKTAGANLARISELNKLRAEEAKKLLDTSSAISEADKQISQNRLKQYSQELAVAEKIAAVRATTEDSSYSFMDQEMPGGFQNPINYWESWGKAMKSIQEAGENGYIGIQDYYNMITHIQDLAVQTGKDMKFMGMTISQDGTSAATLIEEGFKAMTLDVESGNTVLSLDKLSSVLSEAGFDFKAGAEGFDENIQNGIHEFAKSQVKMLDGMIKFVETIVAMEKLGDLDTSGNGIIDLDEIFDGLVNWADGTYRDKGKYTEQYQKVAEYLSNNIEGLEQITVEGHTLKEILEDAIDGTKGIDINLYTLQSLLQALWNTSKSQNYDENDIYNSILETFQINGISGELSIGQQKVYVDASSGIILEFSDENNHWLYNGKDLGDDPQEALKQALAMRTEELENLGVEVPETIKAGDKTVEQPIHNTFVLSVSQVDAYAKDANVKFVEKPENPGSIPELEVTTPQANITKIGAVSWDSKGIIDNKNLGTITSADIVGALNQLGINNVEQLVWALGGVTTPTGFNGNAPLDANNICAVLTALGINDVNTLSWALGQQLTGQFTESMPATLSAMLQTLSILGANNITPSKLFLTLLSLLPLYLAATLHGQASGANVDVNKDGIDTSGAKTTIETEAGNISLPEAIATFGSLIVGLQTHGGNGDNLSGGSENIDSQKIKDALDNYKKALKTENEDKALEALFATLGIDINNPTPESQGALKEFLTKASLEERELFINFATMLLGWTGKTYSGNGDPLTGGKGTGDIKQDNSLTSAIQKISTMNNKTLSVFFATILAAVNTDEAQWDEDEENKVKTALSALGFTNEEINAIFTTINASLGNAEGQTSPQIDGMADVKSSVEKLLAEEEVPGNIIKGVIETIEAELGDNLQAKRLSNVKEAKLRAELKEACDLTNEQIDAIINTINAKLADTNGGKTTLRNPDTVEEAIRSKLLTFSNDKLSNEKIDTIITQVMATLTATEAEQKNFDEQKIRDLLAAFDLTDEEIEATITTIKEQLANNGNNVNTKYPDATKAALKRILANQLNLSNETVEAIIKYIKAKVDNAGLSNEGADKEALRSQVIKLLSDGTGEISIGTIDAIIAGYNLIINSNLEEPNPNDFDTRKAYNSAMQQYFDNQREQENNQKLWNDYLNEVFSTGNIDSLSLALTTISVLSGEGAVDENGNLELGNKTGSTILSKLFASITGPVLITNEDKQAFANQVATHLQSIGINVTPEQILAAFDKKKLEVTNVPTEPIKLTDVNDPKINLELQLDKITVALGNKDYFGAANKLVDALVDESNEVIATDKYKFDVGNLVFDFSSITDFAAEKLLYEIDKLEPKARFAHLLGEYFQSLMPDTPITLPGLTLQLAQLNSKATIIIDPANGFTIEDLEGNEYVPEVDVKGNITGFKQVGTDNIITYEDLFANVNAIFDENQVQGALDKFTVDGGTEGEGGSGKAKGTALYVHALRTRAAAGGSHNRDRETQYPDYGPTPIGGGGTNSPLFYVPQAEYFNPLWPWRTHSKGNVALSGGTNTLMGELGPELVVSNGRYFVVGQSGAEMVNLPDDAIVFNHLQTKQLLTHGNTGRGKPTTNEKNAVSFAKGGPAQASASSALATLKHLKAQWEAIANASLQDLASTAGGGGGGGNDNLAIFIKDVERWYNWLQKIARLEEQITYQEQLRSKIQSDFAANGKIYYNSQKQSLKALEEQAATASSLAMSQEEFYKKRMRDLENSPFARFYEFDEFDQIKYKSSGFTELSQLLSTNDQGLPNYTAEQQYNWLIAEGYADFMKYDSSGQEIKKEDDVQTFYSNSVQAFFDRLDAEKEELQGLHDSVEEQKKAVLEKIEKMNELLKDMRDNQKDVENSVLKAIEDSRKREIDELSKQKDAISESADKLVDGLSESLEKERKLYENNQANNELNKLRRQLSILQRSGGSAAEIASLQNQIDEQSRDQYFDKQQEQIDAVKEASDKQIERMDTQIELMNETLEYQKANGLLWGQVYEVMSGNAQEIAAFVSGNDSSFWASSPLASTEDVNDLIFKAEKWVEFRDDVEGIYDTLNAQWGIFQGSMKEEFGSGWDAVSNENKAAMKQIFDAKLAETGDYNAAAAAARQSSIYQDLKKQQEANTKPLNINNTNQTQANNGPQHLYKATYIIRTYDDRGIPLSPIADKNGNWFGTGVTEKDAQNSAKWIGQQRAIAMGLKRFDIIPSETAEKIYKNGGLIDYTGPAWVDGTKQRPESILNADTTRLLKDNLFNTSKLNLLSSFWDTLQGYETAANHSYSNNSESLVIENAVVNMNVASIANDYDAHRAGEQAMEEMLRIARKTRVSNF